MANQEKKTIYSMWDMGYLGYSSTNISLLSQYSILSLISHFSQLNIDIKILYICNNSSTISTISTILDETVNTISKRVNRTDRDNDLVNKGLLSKSNDTPALYTITDKGIALLKSIETNIINQEKEREAIQKREESLKKEVEDIEMFIKDLYYEQVNERKRLNKKWFCIDFQELAKTNSYIADRLLDDSVETIKKFEVAVQTITDKEMSVKFKNLPKSSNLMISEVRKNHINKMFSFDGIIKQTSFVSPLITQSQYECPSCGELHTIVQMEHKLVEPKKCGCGYSGRFIAVEQKRIDFQIIKIEELPEQLLGRTNPGSITVILKGVLAKHKLQSFYNPGSRIRINGIVIPEPIIKNNGKDVKERLVIEANYVEPQEKTINYKITAEEKEKVKELANSENCLKILQDSFSPDLIGMDKQKLAVLCALVGGGNTKRDKIHILLAGEPGMAKSELLKEVTRLFPFSRYANGSSSSTVGLTASVLKDEATGLWSLVAGTIVMANNGIACIDEIDKMKDEHKNDLNESAEQGTVTINKAGINGTLQANTTMIMASNPKGHTFDMHQPFMSQLNLPYALITRFDIIFILRNSDQQMLNLFEVAMDEPKEKETITEDLFVKYIISARERNPTLTKEAKMVIKDKMQGIIGFRATIDKNIPLTFRQLQAMIRLSTAFAKLRFSKYVEEVDVNNAWELYAQSIKSSHIHNMETEEEKVE
jgi:replicative DNA helicase Mcm